VTDMRGGRGRESRARDGMGWDGWRGCGRETARSVGVFRHNKNNKGGAHVSNRRIHDEKSVRIITPHALGLAGFRINTSPPTITPDDEDEDEDDPLYTILIIASVSPYTYHSIVLDKNRPNCQLQKEWAKQPPESRISGLAVSESDTVTVHVRASVSRGILQGIQDTLPRCKEEARESHVTKRFRRPALVNKGINRICCCASAHLRVAPFCSRR
jgi:hypothetical protein